MAAQKVADFLHEHRILTEPPTVLGKMLYGYAGYMAFSTLAGIAMLAAICFPDQFWFFDLMPILSSDFYVWCLQLFGGLNHAVFESLAGSAILAFEMLGLESYLYHPLAGFILMTSPAWLFAGILEELEFRGPLLWLLKKNINQHIWLAAAVLSGIIFSVIHPYPLWGTISVLGCPVINTWLLYKTKRLWPCMVLHNLFNLQVTLMSL